MKRIDVHNHGHVVLEDWMGSDLHIVNNARVSFDQGSQLHDPDCPMTNSDRKSQTSCTCDGSQWYSDDGSHRTELAGADKGLINFLMRERHGSPFEAPVFRFDIKAPLFVVRECQRHRMGSYNEQSGRYSEIPEHFYLPDEDYVRTQVGYPGNYSFETIEDPDTNSEARKILHTAQKCAFGDYHKLLDMGVAKELARTVLPVGMFSRMKVTMNLRGLFNFLSLRNHEHAQREIRDYAVAMEQMASEVCPVAFEAFVKNGRVCP